MNARSCFVITAIKNDYNKKLRKFCMGTHGECIKERQDITVDKEGDGPQRHFDWKDKYVCKISPEKIIHPKIAKVLSTGNRKLKN